jgi:glycosyltransferase involved in cell wall biosynthesis
VTEPIGHGIPAPSIVRKPDADGPRIAVLLPCRDEEAAIERVVLDFRAALPQADIYVYDNNSQDRTVEVAQRAGAHIGSETLQGKGHVVRRMFADVEADIYVLADADDTYHAASAPQMIRRLLEASLDMVSAVRVASSHGAYRPGHQFGNVLLTKLVAKTFGNRVNDMLSGYRVMSRRFVKSFPALSTGFEIETELTVHALELHMPIADMESSYKRRPTGSQPKLRTYRDGFCILRTIVTLVRDGRPLQFFLAGAALLASLAIGLAMPVVVTFAETGLVPRFPTAILATGLSLLSFLSVVCGLILDTVTRGRREMKRLFYLSIQGPRPEWREYTGWSV